MKSVSRIAALCFLVACRSNPGLEEEVVNAQPMATGVAYGDCVEARRRAAVSTDLEVDSLPRPVRQRPAPFRSMPDAVRRHISAKGSSVKVNVVIDTLGRPDMKTFEVVESTHPWLAANLRASIPTWRFRAARLAGCKVSRVYKFSATSRPRKA